MIDLGLDTAYSKKWSLTTFGIKVENFKKIETFVTSSFGGKWVRVVR